MNLLIPDRERGGYRYHVTPEERWPPGWPYITPNYTGRYTRAQLEEWRRRDYEEYLAHLAAIGEMKGA